MKVIQELVAYFERNGRLTPEQKNHLLRQGYLASDGPATMMGLCDQPGATYYFRVEGADAGTVWGTDVYTADSALAAAAVHAGAVALGERAVVKVTVVDAPAQYTGSSRNGILANDWGRYDGAFRVDRT